MEPLSSQHFPVASKKNNRIILPAIACSGNDSCLWLTDNNGSLVLINKQTATIFPTSEFGVGSNADITSMLLDRDGRSVWIGYGLAGIVHFDGGAVKKRIVKNDGLASDRITSIARDSSENLWFASGVGVAVLRDTILTQYLTYVDGNFFGGCNALFVDKSGMGWTYADSGIVRFDGSSWKLFNSAAVSPDLPYESFSHIIQDKSGTVWFGTEGSGLLAYADNRWYQFTTRDGIPHNCIRSCVLDNKDNLWILTDNGIAMRTSGGIAHSQTRRDFVNPGNKQKIKQIGNRFYVTSNNKPHIIRYTLFDLPGRIFFRQTIHGRNSFVLPENRFGSGVLILSITLEDNDGSQNNYFLKMNDINY